MSTASLIRAQTITRDLLTHIEPGQLGAATPCASWSVRDVINHLVSANRWFVATMATGEAAVFDAEEHADGDFVSSYDRSCEAAAAAFAAPGALDATVTLALGKFPAAIYLSLATCENFAHGWDLARATGQASDLDPSIAEELIAGPVVRGLSDERRGPDGVASFGPLQSAPPGASAADRLAALLGRVV